jgi:aryl-alcohol dehydrogenase-like predicted oxidoreductase
VEYRRVGRSGLVVSAVGLGTVLFGTHVDEAVSRRIISRALELGITLLDTSDSYGRGASETLIGKTLGPRRRDVVLATKFSSPMGDAPWQAGTSRQWMMRAVEDSLRRLGTDVIDLYQIHHPDPRTPIEETLRALDDLVRAGKVRYVGYSNVAGWQIADGQWTTRTARLVQPVSTTNHFNLARRDPEREILPACRAFGVGLIPYYPLESGFLTGRYRRGAEADGIRLPRSARAPTVLTDANFARLERWREYAAVRGRSLLELAFGWLLAHPEVPSVIAGASSPEQVAGSVAAAAAWKLEPAQMAEVAALG